MKIKSEKGIVTFLMKTGKDLVRSTMGVGYADTLLQNAKSKEQVSIGGEKMVLVDNKYYLPIVLPKKKETSEEVVENE